MYRLIEKLHLERYLNSRLILAIDLVVSGVASLCALVLVRLLLPPLSNISKFALLWIGCAVVYSFITFFLLKTYRSVIRHSTLREIAKFVVAVIGKELLLFPCEEDAADRWFKCKLYFITLDEKSGAEKKTATNMLVQAADLRDAVKKLDEGMQGSMADYSIASIAETAIMDVYPYSAEPDVKPEFPEAANR